MVRSVVVFIQNRPFLGALLVHVPLLRALRSAYPSSRVHVYSPFESASMLVDWGEADGVRVYGGPKAVPLSRTLRRDRPDIVLSLRRKSLRVAFAVATSGAGTTIGFRHGIPSRLYRHRVPLDKTVYRAVAALRLLEPLRLSIDPSAALVFADPMGSPASRSAGRDVCLIPCASDDRKQWGVSRYLELCRLVLAGDPAATFTFILGPRESAFRDRIERAGLDAPVTCLVEADVPVIAAAVRGARLTVTNDCAPGHVAQMAGGRVVCVFGNWDGYAARRVGEWFYRRPGSTVVTTDGPGAIVDIPPHAVLAAAAGLDTTPAESHAPMRL